MEFLFYIMATSSQQKQELFIDNKTIAENGYNLSVSSYVEAEDSRPKTDIKELNARIVRIVEHENRLRAEIDAISTNLNKKQYEQTE